MFVPTSRSTTTIENANAETLDISPSYHLRSILCSGQQLRFLRAFLATPPSPPLSALLDHLIRVPNDRRPRAILQHTFQRVHPSVNRASLERSRIQRHNGRSMTPLFPGSKQLATSHLRVVTFIIVMCRAKTSTDPMFGLYDLKNAGPPTYASYRSPRASAVPPLDLPRREPRDSPFRGRDRRGGLDLAGAL
ncbi:hypothetical protein C8J57DRAFT_1512899 [Mycena rebaudengoi]|nr:hypothetical protein C8J57DRAFT_1512899 [Mycena rebaudengoi]